MRWRNPLFRALYPGSKFKVIKVSPPLSLCLSHPCPVHLPREDLYGGGGRRIITLIAEVSCHITPIVEIIGFYSTWGHILSLYFSMGGRIHEHHFGICETSGQEKGPLSGWYMHYILSEKNCILLRSVGKWFQINKPFKSCRLAACLQNSVQKCCLRKL